MFFQQSVSVDKKETETEAETEQKDKPADESDISSKDLESPKTGMK